MTLYDIVEMFCDWCAAAEKKRTVIDIDYLASRFSISPQLASILVNTMNDLDFWCTINGHATDFTPVDKRKHNRRGLYISVPAEVVG